MHITFFKVFLLAMKGPALDTSGGHGSRPSHKKGRGR